MPPTPDQKLDKDPVPSVKTHSSIRQNAKTYHGNTFVYLLPQMGSEDLDEGDLQGRNFSVEEDTSQIQLDLKTNLRNISL